MSAKPVFSVIIPMYNNWEQLQLCIDALAGQTFNRDQFEIIVVDNASTKNRPEDFRVLSNMIIEYESEPGSYSARNRGAEFAMGTYLAFTDADCIPDKDWLKNAHSLFERTGCDSIGGEIEIFRADGGKKHAYIYESYHAFKQKDWVPDGISCTANHFVKKSVFEAVNGFDTSLKSGGDWEFSKRCVSKGYVMEYGADVIVRHPARKNLKAMLKKHYRHICWGSLITREKYNCSQFWFLLSALKGSLSSILKQKPYIKSFRHRLVVFYIDLIKMSMQLGVNILMLIKIIDPKRVRE